MKKGIIAIASVIAVSLTLFSCNFLAPKPVPSPETDSPKTVKDSIGKDTSKSVVSSAKKDSLSK